MLTRETGRVAFVAEGRARNPTVARAQARTEALAAAASYISVDVRSTFVDTQTSGRTESQSITEQLDTSATAQLAGVWADKLYWERTARGVASDDGEYRAFVRLWVPRGEIERVRAAKRARRASTTNQKSIVLLPLARPSADEHHTLSTAAADGLRGWLERSPGLRLIDPAVANAVAGHGPTWSRVERVQDSLLPDRIFAGATERRGDQIKITLVEYDGKDGHALETHSVRGDADDLLSLVADLSGRIGVELGSKAESPNGPSTAAKADASREARLSALHAYARAYDHFERGDNDKALEQIHRAIELTPDDPRPYIRLGRILERLGRYGRVPPKTAADRARYEVDVCSDASKAARARADKDLAERRAKFQRKAATGQPWWTDETKTVDEVLTAAVRAIVHTRSCEVGAPCANDEICSAASHLCVCAGGATCPKIDVTMPTSAVEAYFLAIDKANASGQGRLVFDIALALANLAIRVDRLDHAWTLLQAVVAHPDPHFQSLARLGQGIVLKKHGDLGGAAQHLQLALHLRTQLGEKPYLLEIFNELGGVAMAQGQLTQAQWAYEQAQYISRELDNEYLTAVLANNIGVLEQRQGHAADAQDKIERAAKRLTDLAEAEGMTTTGVNLAFIGTLAGRADEAADRLDEVEHVLGDTAQEGKLAELHAHRGLLKWNQDDANEALYHLHMSWGLAAGLGQTAMMRRAQDNLLVVELTSSPGASTCVKEAYWSMGVPVFERLAARRVQSIATVPIGQLSASQLAAASNGAVASLLSDWTASKATVRPDVPPPRGLGIPPPVRVSLDDIEAQREKVLTERPDDMPSVQPTDVPTEIGVADVLEIVPGIIDLLKPAAEPPPVPYQKRAEYERILGTFSIDAQGLSLIDPRTAERILAGRVRATARRSLGGVIRHAHAAGAKRIEATARLNRAAVYWRTGEATAAYREIMRAREMFIEVADARGFAYADEWVGVMLAASGAHLRAAEHLGLALAQHRARGHRADAERVRAYAPD